MNIFLIVGAAFFSVVVVLIFVVSLLPSPTINHLLRRSGKRAPQDGGPKSSQR